MAESNVALESVTVVLKGSFNPAIFSPAWLRLQDLIGDKELEAQEVEVITKDLSVFKAGWLGCQVSDEALQLSTVEPEEYERLRDAAVGILRVLMHTPIAAMGINHEVHFTVDSIEQWHAIGDALVPKEPWQEVLHLPGMRNLVIWGARPDGYGGYLQVQVEPSVRFPQAVYVLTNDHFSLTVADEKPSRDRAWVLSREQVEPASEKIDMAQKLLLEEWTASLKRAEANLGVVSGIVDSK